MKTAKLTPTVWFDRLKNGTYEKLGDVKKGLSKTSSWTQKERAAALSVATAFFEKGVKSLPNDDVQILTGGTSTKKTTVAAVKPEGKTAKPEKKPRKQAKVPAPTAAPVVKSPRHTGAVLHPDQERSLDSLQGVIATHLAVIDGIQKAVQDFPELDVSQIDRSMEQIATASRGIKEILGHIIPPSMLGSMTLSPTAAATAAATMASVAASANGTTTAPTLEEEDSVAEKPLASMLS